MNTLKLESKPFPKVDFDKFIEKLNDDPVFNDDIKQLLPKVYQKWKSFADGMNDKP